jgi:hypothetical protein
MQFVGGSYESESTPHLRLSTTTIEATNGPYKGRREKLKPQASIRRNGFEWVGNYLQGILSSQGQTKWLQRQEATSISFQAYRISTSHLLQLYTTGHYANKCPNPRQNKPHPQRQGSGESKSHHDKKPNIQVKKDQLNFMGIVSTREHLSLWLTIFYCFVNNHCGLLMVKPSIHPYILVAFQD